MFHILTEIVTIIMLLYIFEAVAAKSYQLKDLSYSSKYDVSMCTAVGRSESAYVDISFYTPSCLNISGNDLLLCGKDFFFITYKYLFIISVGQ